MYRVFTKPFQHPFIRPIIAPYVLRLPHPKSQFPFTHNYFATSTTAMSSNDICWNPICPPGHTVYSWGEDGAMNSTPQSAVPVQKETKSAPQQDNAAKPAAKPKQKQQPKKKQQQKPNTNKAANVSGEPNDTPDFYRMHMVVGKIVSCEKHPNADSLYVEQIDVGEASPRQIVSGLVKYVPLEKMINSPVIVVMNLKPGNLRSVKSYGMVLAASDAKKTMVELVMPPADAPVGTRITLQGDESFPEPDAQVNPTKKVNVWLRVAPEMKTNANSQACFGDKVLVTPQGPLTASKEYANGIVS